MKFTIITNLIHLSDNQQYFGYAPYIREMNIWIKYVDDVIIVAPIKYKKPSDIDIAYKHNKIDFRLVADFNFIGFKNKLRTIVELPSILWRIFWAMKNADHIHLRCPGNIGLLGCFVQIMFPNKKKTAKYAGNWDFNSKQPWTYNLQKRILNNTFLTRNMTVLVYGEWANQSKNIKSFFTATYSENEKEIVQKKDLESVIEFIFVGSLVPGKNPLYAVELVEKLVEKENNVILNLYGEGIERTSLENYIKKNKLEKNIFLHGNKNQETIKKAYKKSHFVILPSKSEGWPKAIAEGMFWGCVPVATKVSCIPFMLDQANRGVLLEMDLKKDIEQIEQIIKNQNSFFIKSKLASEWSGEYTIDVFESEVEKILKL
ncbi:glycosyltransferase [Flavobacterium sp. LC2016-12]|uniref:glycosyltransferase n=1 Tax=Flavobacterium sp. LC2016-12 TaxID=2783794 RepID=UPI00188A48E9|nr:glycosyltransferase [Flavobacterium sp. LC2016-12]MBF4465637.1 glycosyltransferase family 4 protein [Flavobacterium sp. LC2016-12]